MHDDPAPDETAVKTGDAVESPLGFVTYAANAGIKDKNLDLSIVASQMPCVAAGVFTQSRFAGPSVVLCRRHLESGSPRAIVTISNNANVANGAEGERDAAELAALAAKVIGSDAPDVLVASTGVIGRPYPMERIRRHFQGVRMPETADFPSVARAIMTTDTVPKLASTRVGGAMVTGVAKGAGMIEPNMATLLGYVVTDAAIPRDEMDSAFRRVVDVTFNSLSIDTDTSTSDTVLLLANGAAGPVGKTEFAAALRRVCGSLVLQLAADGEGATKVIEVTVGSARDPAQAKRIAKAVVNSPLVKSAVHGADPNWGRVIMAIGKCSNDTDILPEAVRVSFGHLEVYPGPLGHEGLEELSEVMRSDIVHIVIALGVGEATATVWGCDLSAEYVRINADYTT